MPSKTLPPGEEHRLDEREMTDLVDAAMVAALPDLSGQDVPERDVFVTRPVEGGYESGPIVGPWYWRIARQESINDGRKSGASARLLEKLWSNGVPKIAISSGGAVDRTDWERFVWDGVVLHRLLDLLQKKAMIDLATLSRHVPWQVETEEREKCACDVAGRLCGTHRRIQGACPVLGLHCSPGETHQLAPGVKIEAVDDNGRCVFHTLFSRELDSDVFRAVSTMDSAILRIDRTVAYCGDEEAVEQVVRAVDTVKWAAMAAGTDRMPFLEGPIAVEGLGYLPWPSKGTLSTHSGQIRTLHRDRRLPGVGRSTTNVSLETDAERIADRISLFWEASKHAPGLNDALWMFGRSCVGPIERDALLDAAIGLESLLVPGGGDSRYRFWLHGTAILGDDESGSTKKVFTDIYKGRSHAAHEAARSGGRDDLVKRARTYLTRVIEACAELIQCGELGADLARKDVGKAVEDLVARRVRESRTE